MENYAKLGEFGRGYHPRCDYWRGEAEKIRECPKFPKNSNTPSVAAFFGGGLVRTQAVKCTCRYHPRYRPPEPEVVYAPVPARTPVTPSGGRKIVPGSTRTPSPRKVGGPVEPKKIYSLGNQLPKVPKKLEVDEIKNKIGWKRERNTLDLFYYSPTGGECFYCGGFVRVHGVCDSLKLVWNYGFPYTQKVQEGVWFGNTILVA